MKMSPRNADHITNVFVEGFKDNFLYQHVKTPTRYRNNQVPSLLDLVLTNEENMVEEIETLPSLDKSDHITLKFKYNWAIP